MSPYKLKVKNIEHIWCIWSTAVAKYKYAVLVDCWLMFEFDATVLHLTYQASEELKDMAIQKAPLLVCIDSTFVSYFTLIGRPYNNM